MDRKAAVSDVHDLGCNHGGIAVFQHRPCDVFYMMPVMAPFFRGTMALVSGGSDVHGVFPDLPTQVVKQSPDGGVPSDFRTLPGGIGDMPEDRSGSSICYVMADKWLAGDEKSIQVS